MKGVLVTGATGFIGSELCRLLCERGLPTVGAVRRTAPAGHGGVKYVPVGDIGPETDWSEALVEVDAVVHLAARVHRMDEDASEAEAEYMRVNTEATLRLARMAREARVRRVVYLSSIKVNGEVTRAKPFCEDDAAQPLDPYAVSKHRAEEGLRALHDPEGLQVTIVRPPLVYGPGVGANFFRLLRLVDRGLPLPLGVVRNKRSLVGIRNLTGFLLTCLTHSAAAGETFLVSDGEDLSTPDLVRAIARALGRPARLVPVPPRLLALAGALTGRRDVVDRLCSSLQVSVDKARRLLAWTPAYAPAEEIDGTARWYETL